MSLWGVGESEESIQDLSLIRSRAGDGMASKLQLVLVSCSGLIEEEFDLTKTKPDSRETS